MNRPTIEHKQLSDINNIRQLAYDTLFEKYIMRNLRGEEKLFLIDSTDQESLITTLNGGFPIPGLMYTFVYRSQGDEIIQAGKKNISFSDKVPLVFCVGGDRKMLKGLNMNMLPPEERLKFLDAFYDAYKEFFQDVERLAENDKLAINKKYLLLAATGRGQKLINSFSAAMNANFSFAFRSYDFKKIFRFRMVEFSEWNYLPFYDPKDAFSKLNQLQMHKLYYKSK